MHEAPFRTAPVDDIVDHIIARSHRRYGLTTLNSDVANAWTLLVSSSYSQDLSVQDGTGVPHLPGNDATIFWEADRYTPEARSLPDFQGVGSPDVRIQCCGHDPGAFPLRPREYRPRNSRATFHAHEP
jgi:hypothetical protein